MSSPELRLKEEILRPQKPLSFQEMMQILRKDNLDRLQKPLAILRYLKSAFPFLFPKENKGMYSQENLPFDFEQLEFGGKIGIGSERDVYFLKSKVENVPSYVMKVTNTKHEDAAALTKEAADRKARIDQVKGLYAEISHIIPSEHYMVSEGPRTGEGKTLISIQKFLGENIRDFFEIPIEKLKRCAKKIEHSTILLKNSCRLL